MFHGQASQIYLDVARENLEKGEIEKSKLNLNYAQEKLRIAFSLDPNNKVLKSIDNNIQKLSDLIRDEYS